MRLLLAEDDRRLSAVLARGLREHAYAVDVLEDGRRALTEALVIPYDVILLDVMLPSLTGLEISKTLRARGVSSPILMLTARDAIPDRIGGLDAGADDYLVKPFAFDELLARIRALLRRGPRLTPTVITIGDLEVDTRQRVATRAGHMLALTTKEYVLLEYLVREQGRVVPRSEISDHVWDDNHDPASNNIDVLMARLRRKLDAANSTPLLHTRRGAGYMIDISCDDA
ncbi:MAG TPA: response regulator transcription factor [Gemmatimonadaceae bacterium]|jgi:two-component system copper resistance phosphate regulon response regulator CusR